MSVDFQRTTRCYIPEDGSLHNYRCENLKSNVMNKPHVTYTHDYYRNIVQLKEYLTISYKKKVGINSVLPPMNKVLLERLMVAQLIKSFLILNFSTCCIVVSFVHSISSLRQLKSFIVHSYH
jgi:hypothetical protein